MDKIFSKPINTFFSCILLSLFLLLVGQVSWGIIISPLVSVFWLYLLVSFFYNLYLVLSGKLTLRTYLIVPAILIIIFIFFSFVREFSFLSSLNLNMFLGGIMIFLIELFIDKQKSNRILCFVLQNTLVIIKVNINNN